MFNSGSDKSPTLKAIIDQKAECELPLRPGFHIQNSRYYSRIIVDRTTLGEWEEVSEYGMTTLPKSSSSQTMTMPSSNSSEVIIESSNYVNFNNVCSEDKEGFHIQF